MTSNLCNTRCGHVTVFVHCGARVNATILERAVRYLERATLRFLRDLDTVRGCKRFWVLLPLYAGGGSAHNLTGQPQRVRAIDYSVPELKTPSWIF